MHNNVDYIGQPVDLIEARFAQIRLLFFFSFHFSTLLQSLPRLGSALLCDTAVRIKQYLNL